MILKWLSTKGEFFLGLGIPYLIDAFGSDQHAHLLSGGAFCFFGAMFVSLGYMRRHQCHACKARMELRCVSCGAAASDAEG